MKRLFYFFTLYLFVLSAYAANDEIALHGRVKSAIANVDLTNAYVLRYDSAGNIIDSIRANNGYRWTGNGVDTLSNFYMYVPRVDSVYVFDVVCEGFKPQTVVYELTNVKKRETYRTIPVIYMQRAPIQLKEVSVTATKIKFYNKGDTTVYDASAFELAEGSMLDALIAQLPGAELSTDGQIKINGQFVESLLLDGKQFFNGDNNLMLENIAAYTVKNIQVYEGVSKRDQLAGNNEKKVLTMDVRLKKEYSIGWILNLQGGYGTAHRYMGRAFASWFNPKWRVSLVGNVNNLNDNRQPGRNDTWTPEMMPQGKKEYYSAGVNYNFETPDEKTSAEGSLRFRQTVNNVESFTDRINFLQGGDTYERSFADMRSRQTSVTTYHSFMHNNGKIGTVISVNGTYADSKNSDNALAATFGKDPGELTRKTLEAIYSDGTPAQLESIINRSATMNDGWNRVWNINVFPQFIYLLPSRSDRLLFSFSFDYSTQKEDLWKDYEINYGANPIAAQKLRQFFDNSPNVNRTADVHLDYKGHANDFYYGVGYMFRHSDVVKDSYMYALDHLNDMGIYGMLAADYQLALDPANSYTSHLWQNNHNISPTFQFFKRFEKSTLSINFFGNLTFMHRKFAYWRNNQDYRHSTQNTLFGLTSSYDATIFYYFGSYGEGRDANDRHMLRYSYIIDPKVPNLFDMVDVVNDADPLNIYLGNPDLRMAIKQRHQIWWFYKPQSYSFQNDFSVSYTTTRNELIRGYTYDTSTGVRYNRMYNVDGNHNFAVSDNVRWQFGRTKQFTLTYTIDAGFQQSTDMIGVNKEEPEINRVHNASANQKFKITWQLGKQNIGLRYDMVTRHTTSSQQGFNTLNANHISAGVQGVFALPAGFGISTDFMCYTRRGYGSPNLDTTDPVWNLRVTYAPPRNNHWVIMLDGFDMLHQLSNVNYAVTASGRTISYTNMLPRYIMLSVQYRLNIQPKKK